MRPSPPPGAGAAVAPPGRGLSPQLLGALDVMAHGRVPPQELPKGPAFLRVVSSPLRQLVNVGSGPKGRESGRQVPRLDSGLL